MTSSAWLALQFPGLATSTEHAPTLAALAEWALDHAALVALDPPDGLLLEVGSMLRYFGGLQPLLARVQASLAARQQPCRWAVAPTPLAANWCARQAPGTSEVDPAALPALLGPLPIQVLDLPVTLQQDLAGSGLLTLADCLRVPAAALSRRIGLQAGEQLARALGQWPDPRTPFRLPARWQRHVELPAPVPDLAPCRQGLLDLLVPLAAWLQQQALLLTAVELVCHHERQPATRLPLGFAGTARLEHLQAVFRMRLEALQLPAAACAFTLRVIETRPGQEAQASWLAPVAEAGGAAQEWLERLRARLGAEAVRGLQWIPDHRPEQAWCVTEPGQPSQVVQAEGQRIALPPRPLWWLEQPRDLGPGPLPVLRYPLQLLAGPERIALGWWDGCAVARDYFVACATRGPATCYWVYRPYLSDSDQAGSGSTNDNAARKTVRRWYLQGVFA